MNNDTEQPVEATDSGDARPSVTAIAAKTEPKDILDGLTRDLNNLILITISAVYYFDCFSILFLVRYVGQVQSTSGGVRVVLGTNLICLLTHVFHSLPQPEPREFWNHGGMLVDFVGEKPPTRFKVIVLDLVIVALQILYLALYYKNGGLDGGLGKGERTSAQDLEAEEAGILRANPPDIQDTENGVEMESLLPDGQRIDREGQQLRHAHDDTIVLRRLDLKEVFLNTTRNTASDESTAALRRFIERVHVIRARRAAQQAGNSDRAA